MANHIHWLGHDAFKLSGRQVVYIDPYEIGRGEVADIILITHKHHDHCSPKDVQQIQGADSVIVAPADCAKELKGNILAVKPGDTLTIHGIRITAVPAYNVDKTFHPRTSGWVGYLVSMDGVTIYHAGDTDFIPEMKSLQADIALLPVSGTYTMTAEEAAQAALAIRPKIAIPMHYGTVVGTARDAENFRDALKGKVSVLIKERE